MLGFAGKLPFEQRTDSGQNGLKVVELEVEGVGSDTEGQLVPPGGEPVPIPDADTTPTTTDCPVPVKEDPTQSTQADPHLTAQDMRRAKRIRVRLLRCMYCPEMQSLRWPQLFILKQCVSLSQCVLPLKMDMQVGWA